MRNVAWERGRWPGGGDYGLWPGGRGLWPGGRGGEDAPSKIGFESSSCSFTLPTSAPLPDTAATYCIESFDASRRGEDIQHTGQWHAC